jgi:uncharacterized protein YbaR (Trm112 family)
MADNRLSIAIVCPKCGKQLVGASGTNRAPLTDMLSCPDHGEVGKFDDMIQKLSEDADRKVGEALDQFLKGPDSR